MALGRSDEPLPAIGYFYFSCPHCGSFHSNVFPELKRNYIDRCKIMFVGASDHDVGRAPAFPIDGMKYVRLVSYPRIAAILDTLLQ